jgi:hypothetical protein
MMGTSELRDTFNSIASPRYSCDRALLHYDRADGKEWQVLSFSGRGADGNGFTVMSSRIGPSGDLAAAARETAQRLLDRQAELT